MTEHNERAPGPSYRHPGVRILGCAIALLFLVAASARAQQPAEAKPSMEVYGFAMLDIGQNFTTIHPNWFDTMRVTKLPSFEGQYGKDQNTFAGVRQSRFGVRSNVPTTLGELKTTFEFEMFGVGVDEGQTTFRLRHAYGELGAFGAGQTWSPFMDPNVFPNSLEYWGPTGMVFFRNVQFRWMPIRGDTSLTIAIERPGASGDPGTLANRVELQNITGRFPLPDLTGQYTFGRKWGYVRAAGALRRINYDDTLNDQFDLSGHVTGWGLNFSSIINMNEKKTDVIRLQYVYGRGIENYMNDSPVDVGVEANPGNPTTPVKGKALPIHGVVAFVEHAWTERWSTTAGYSGQKIENTPLDSPNAFHIGNYALANVLFTPVSNVLMGGEFQWGQRRNFSDGFRNNGYKLQFSFKYNFSYKVGG